MIAITGAGGKTGATIIEALVKRGIPVRTLVRTAGDQAKSNALATDARDHSTLVESVVGDMRDTAALQNLLRGAIAAYHICPNMHPQEVEIGATLLNCARKANVQQVVYHSVLHPQTAAMPHHWQKMQVEELIFQSGIPFTLLQPTAYMQNLLAYWQTVRQQASYVVPYPIQTRISLVDLRDVAEVAVRVLTEPGHLGATYELVGSAPLSQAEVAAAMSKHLGRAVVADEMPLDAWEKQARANQLPTYAIDTLRKMFIYYANYGLVGNSNVLEWLLGRAPTSLETFLQECAPR